MVEENKNPLRPPSSEPGEQSEGDLKQDVIDELSSIFDPEIPVNIYELGLIYEVKINEEQEVAITMTLTAPSCPVAGELPGQVEDRVKSVPGVKSAKVELVWEPPWTTEKMSEAAKLQLGLM